MNETDLDEDWRLGSVQVIFPASLSDTLLLQSGLNTPSTIWEKAIELVKLSAGPLPIRIAHLDQIHKVCQEIVGIEVQLRLEQAF